MFALLANHKQFRRSVYRYDTDFSSIHIRMSLNLLDMKMLVCKIVAYTESRNKVIEMRHGTVLAITYYACTYPSII